MSSGRWLMDTNILIRLSIIEDPQHDLIKAALDDLDRRNSCLYVSLQNMSEFWNVCTRPVDRNGYGLSIVETDRRMKTIERAMILIPDTDQVYLHWRRLVVDHSVRGIQVHDARLVAVMLAHGIPNMLTLNDADFLRFPEITAVHPRHFDA